MNIKLQNKLFDDFPYLYQQKKLSPRHSCLSFGIETGDGWFQLIYDLSKAITELNDTVQACQVKEKFGTLRFYTNSGKPETWNQMNQLIVEAEMLSAETCEVCGKQGQIREEGWIVTLCDDCLEDRNASK